MIAKGRVYMKVRKILLPVLGLLVALCVFAGMGRGQDTGGIEVKETDTGLQVSISAEELEALLEEYELTPDISFSDESIEHDVPLSDPPVDDDPENPDTDENDPPHSMELESITSTSPYGGHSYLKRRGLSGMDVVTFVFGGASDTLLSGALSQLSGYECNLFGKFRGQDFRDACCTKFRKRCRSDHVCMQCDEGKQSGTACNACYGDVIMSGGGGDSTSGELTEKDLAVIGVQFEMIRDFFLAQTGEGGLFHRCKSSEIIPVAEVVLNREIKSYFSENVAMTDITAQQFSIMNDVFKKLSDSLAGMLELDESSETDACVSDGFCMNKTCGMQDPDCADVTCDPDGMCIAECENDYDCGGMTACSSLDPYSLDTTELKYAVKSIGTYILKAR